MKGKFDANLLERSLRYAVERQRIHDALAENREELQRSDSMLREQTAILESILRCIADGVVVADREDRFLVFNPAAERIVGMGAANVDPKNWSKHYTLFLPDGKTPFPNERLPLIRAMRGESVIDEELIVHRRDQAPVVISVNATPLTDQSGALNGGVIVYRDITRQKEANREIRRLNTELEHYVAERTKELASANADLGAFCSSVSHDLRKPLRHIDGFSLTLLEEYAGQLDRRGAKYLRKVRDGAQRMGYLIDALLDLSRTTRGNLRRKKVNLSAATQRILSELQRKDPNRDVECKI